MTNVAWESAAQPHVTCPPKSQFSSPRQPPKIAFAVFQHHDQKTPTQRSSALEIGKDTDENAMQRKTNTGCRNEAQPRAIFTFVYGEVWQGWLGSSVLVRAVSGLFHDCEQRTLWGMGGFKVYPLSGEVFVRTMRRGWMVCEVEGGKTNWWRFQM